MKGAIDKNFLDENGNLLPELKRFNWGAFFLLGYGAFLIIRLSH